MLDQLSISTKFIVLKMLYLLDLNKFSYASKPVFGLKKKFIINEII